MFISLPSDPRWGIKAFGKTVGLSEGVQQRIAARIEARFDMRLRAARGRSGRTLHREGAEGAVPGTRVSTNAGESCTRVSCLTRVPSTKWVPKGEYSTSAA